MCVYAYSPAAPSCVTHNWLQFCVLVRAGFLAVEAGAYQVWFGWHVQ